MKAASKNRSRNAVGLLVATVVLGAAAYIIMGKVRHNERVLRQREQLEAARAFIDRLAPELGESRAFGQVTLQEDPVDEPPGARIIASGAVYKEEDVAGFQRWLEARQPPVPVLYEVQNVGRPIER